MFRSLVDSKNSLKDKKKNHASLPAAEQLEREGNVFRVELVGATVGLGRDVSGASMIVLRVKSAACNGSSLDTRGNTPTENGRWQL